MPSVSPFSTCQPDGISTDTIGGTPTSSAFFPFGATSFRSRESNGGRGIPVMQNRRRSKLYQSHVTLHTLGCNKL